MRFRLRDCSGSARFRGIPFPKTGRPPAMLWRLLAGASVSAASLPSLRRVSNHVVPILHGGGLLSTAGSGFPGLSSSHTHLASSGISFLGTHLKLSAVSTQTASISSGISAKENDDRSTGEGEGSSGCSEYRGSGCPDPTGDEGLWQKDPAKPEDFSPRDLSLLDAAKTEDLSSKDPSKADDLSPEDVRKLVSCLRSGSKSDYADAMQKLELDRLRPSPDSVALVLSRLWKNCDAALAFFSWAMKQRDNQLSCREFHSMVVILVKRQRFEAALSLIQETVRSAASLVTSQTVLFLIKKYCVRGQAKNAVATFDSLVELGYRATTVEFESLLSFLCRFGKVAEAEELLHREKRFPFCTRSFNLVLRGWCEILVSPREAKRVWLTMADMGLQHDVGSYGTMISCLVRTRDVVGALKLFDEMKDLGRDPDMKVYKGVFTAMVIANRVEEVVDLIRKIKEEKGVFPGGTTLGSLFWSACRDGSVEAAVKLLDMLTKNSFVHLKRSLPSKGLDAIFNELRAGKDIMAVLGALKQARFHLPIDTYDTLVRKLCMLQDYDGLFTLWEKMCSKGPKPDRKTYVSIIYGLSSNGKMEAAHRYYLEMRTIGFNPEPRADLGFLVRRMKVPEIGPCLKAE